MINTLSATTLQPLLFTIITPLYRILDDKQVTDDQMGELSFLLLKVSLMRNLKLLCNH